MDFAADFTAAQQLLSDALVATTRTAARVAAQDLPFLRSSDPTIAAALDEKSARLLKLTQKLLHRASAPQAASTTVKLPNIDALDTQWHRVVDTADTLFERADTCLDDFSGLIKTKHTTATTTDSAARTAAPSARLPSSLLAASIPKPQLLFDMKPPNHAKPPFQPLLSSKPHAQTPLRDSLKLWPEEDGTLQHQHPYGEEIRSYRFPSLVYQRGTPTAYESIEASEPIFVDTVDALKDMLRELQSADVIAVDLEHHDAHSYLGIVSLMQISTRDRDWIVDTLKPWRRKLELLNEVFADPSIVKVLHGSHMDVVWLQRDFGLYLVGLFDTYHACRVLGYPRASLAFLLKKFVDFDAQKQYQTADWRIRPLPSEMLDYARSDTHFLIYIFECMRNELLDQTLTARDGQEAIDDVRDRSKRTALQRYEYPHSVDDISSRHNAWAALLTRHPQVMNTEQVSVLAAVHRWREDLARREDEGVSTIMANHALLAVAKALPTSKSELYASIHWVSTFLRERADELLQLVSAAKRNGSGGPDSKLIFASYPSRTAPPIYRSAHGTTIVEPGPNPSPFEPGSSLPTDGDLRAVNSLFWGDTVVSFDFDASGTFVLLPKVTYNAYDVIPGSEILDSQKMTDSRLETSQTKAMESKRESAAMLQSKRPASSGGNSDDGHPTIADGGGMAEEQAALRAVEKRAQRKGRKRARNAASQGAISSPVYNTEGFDYETAPSVLSATTAHTARQGTTKSFNPFAKGDSAASGLKRAQEPRAGKTFTYR